MSLMSSYSSFITNPTPAKPHNKDAIAAQHCMMSYTTAILLLIGRLTAAGFEDSHKTFRRSLAEGFSFEVLEVWSG